MAQSVVTVTGKDRPGIIALVTGLLFRAGANLEDISMTILEGQFAMVMIVQTTARGSEAKIRKTFAALEKSGLSITWRNLTSRARAGGKHRKGSKTWLVTAAGEDRTGIVFKISQFFSSLRLNITDLNSKILPRGKSGLYILMLEVDVPSAFPVKKIKPGLERLAKELRIDIQYRPVEPLEL